MSQYVPRNLVPVHGPALVVGATGDQRAIQLVEMARRGTLAQALATGKTEMASVRATHVAEVKVRRYGDRRQCDVFVDVHGKEMILKCPDFAQAVKWARLECKSYHVESGFSVELIGEPGIHSPDGDKRVNHLHLVR